MIVSSTSYNSENMSSCNLQKSTVLHTPPSDSTVYSSAYLVDSSWSHHHHQPLVNVKQEPEDAINNDSGISPNSYNSDSHNNMSPSSYHSEEPRSEDSGNVDNKSYQSPLGSPPNKSSIQATATVGLVTHSIVNSAQSPRHRLTPPTESPSHLRTDKHNDEHSRSSSSASSNSEHDNSFYEEDSLRRLQMCIQRTGIMGPSLQNSNTCPSDSSSAEKSLHCPLCGFVTNSRSSFNEHLTSHSDQVKCKRCEHTAENKDKLREHLREAHDASMSAEDETGSWMDDEEPGIAVPKVNSQGKVKTYRCKQCNFSAVTKLDFWEHSRVHIKTERQLTCPKCPFVTEYKHHLEYHLRNHYGSKPFKCPKCSYTCVNKSMLNSHMKSHSNVYQFRCLDCTYATKYCHSLKLHLRKYCHNPAAVLYPDGSPNPYPIVDVYGTRRGPKQKPKRTEENRAKSPQLQNQPIPQPISSIFPPYGFVPSGKPIPFPPHLALMNNFQNGGPLFPFQNHPIVAQDTPKMDLENIFPGNNNNTSSINNNQQDVKEYLTRVIATQQEILARSKVSEDCQGSAIDMTKTEQRTEQHHEESTDKTVTPPPNQMSNKNRRKGKAFKLDTIARRLQHQGTDDDDDVKDNYKVKIPRYEETKSIVDEPVKQDYEIAGVDKTETEEAKEQVDRSGPSSPIVNFSDDMKAESTITKERKERWRNVKEVYDCSYCDILFGDIVMYTMHMGYHGYQHPYTCNMCGHQTNTRVEFFLHLFRNSHG